MTPFYSSEGAVLYHGDCRAILPTLGPVALVLTDPPYGVGCAYGICGDEREEVRRLIFQAWPLCRKLTQCLIVTPGNGNQRWYGDRSRETAWTYTVAGRRFWQPVLSWGVDLPLVIDFTPARFGAPADGHPCPKPPDFWAYLLKEAIYLRGLGADAVVLDPFAGSGTTLLVARQLGLRAIGIEQEERFCRLIVQRLESRATVTSATGTHATGHGGAF